MGNYQGKATGNAVWGTTPKGTPFVAVDVQLVDDAGQQKGIITHEFYFVESSAKNIEISVEGLRLLGARIMSGDITDLFGLGSTTAGIVTEQTQYGEKIKYINPPGPRARAVKDEQRMDAGSLAAFRAKMMGRVAGILASKGEPIAAPQPTARAPWQGQQRAAAPAGAAPWDKGAPPQQPAQASTANLDAADVEPWNEPDAYQGLEEPAQAPQQSAPAGPPQQRRAAPF